jgi:hypothetical protein
MSSSDVLAPVDGTRRFADGTIAAALTVSIRLKIPSTLGGRSTVPTHARGIFGFVLSLV